MIGGEFPIAVSELQNNKNNNCRSSDVYFYSSGRAALYQILKYLKAEKHIKHVLLPDYLCSSILVPIQKLGLAHSFYPINEILEIEASFYEKKYRHNSATLLINYFGLKNLAEQIKTIRDIDTNATIIEDDVQAYYEFRKPLNGVDFKFTSLRKTFAIPDGGLVKTKHNMPVVDKPNMFGQYKAAAALLKSMREGNFNDNIYLELFEKGECLIDEEIECGMSRIAEKLYSYINEKQVKVCRLNNARYLLEELEKTEIKPILPLNDDHVPLFIPIAMDNRDAVRKAMFQKDIFCPVHWPLEGLDLQRGKIMAEKELSLIIDQRYGRKEMCEIIAVLKDCLLTNLKFR
jgi:hypothetical protein